MLTFTRQISSNRNDQRLPNILCAPRSRFFLGGLRAASCSSRSWDWAGFAGAVAGHFMETWKNHLMNHGWLVVTCFHILGRIIPLDFHICQRGWTHQRDGIIGMVMKCDERLTIIHHGLSITDSVVKWIVYRLWLFLSHATLSWGDFTIATITPLLGKSISIMIMFSFIYWNYYYDCQL